MFQHIWVNHHDLLCYHDAYICLFQTSVPRVQMVENLDGHNCCHSFRKSFFSGSSRQFLRVFFLEKAMENNTRHQNISWKGVLGVFGGCPNIFSGVDWNNVTGFDVIWNDELLSTSLWGYRYVAPVKPQLGFSSQDKITKTWNHDTPQDASDHRKHYMFTYLY